MNKIYGKKQTGQKKFKANVSLIKEADSGTVWECGYASALGKDVYDYIYDTDTYINRFKKEEKHFDTEVKMIVDNDEK